MRRLASVLLALTAVLVACGDDDSADTIETSTPVTAPEDEESAPTEATETTAVPAEGTLIEVTVTDGNVDGGGRHRVPVGETVTLRVTSDVADHVHLHGYDVLVDVAAGETAELTFDATIPGVFEAELEDARIPLVELEVS